MRYGGAVRVVRGGEFGIVVMRSIGLRLGKARRVFERRVPGTRIVKATVARGRF